MNPAKLSVTPYKKKQRKEFSYTWVACDERSEKRCYEFPHAPKHSMIYEVIS